VGDQETGSPGTPVSSGLQVPGEQGHCRARTRPTKLPQLLKPAVTHHTEKCNN
jgi:hypothetical protein